MLLGGSAAADITLFTAFRRRLEELDWKLERNVRIELRWGEGSVELMRNYASELVSWSPDLLVVYNNQALDIMKPAAGRVPIVFAGVGDPVGDLVGVTFGDAFRGEDVVGTAQGAGSGEAGPPMQGGRQ